MNINKEISVEFLYLDTSVCTRCQDTETNLDDSLEKVKERLSSIGFQVSLNKIHIETEAQTIQQKLISSPTIRVNGEDIQMDVKESHCSTCSSLVNDTAVDCRIWTYNDKEYSAPPKELIIDSILRTVYQTEKSEDKARSDYTLPDNLKQYFKNKDQLCADVGTGDKSSCCDATNGCC